MNKVFTRLFKNVLILKSQSGILQYSQVKILLERYLMDSKRSLAEAIMFFQDHPAYISILNEIKNKTFDVQSPLVPNKIAEEIGYSVIPIREALIRLTSEDVIDCFPKRGFFAKPISDKDISIYQFFLFLSLKITVNNLINNKSTNEKMIKVAENANSRMDINGICANDIVDRFYIDFIDISQSSSLRCICLLSVKTLYRTRSLICDRSNSTSMYRSFFYRLIEAIEKRDCYRSYSAINDLMLQEISNLHSDLDFDFSLNRLGLLDQRLIK